MYRKIQTLAAVAALTLAGGAFAQDRGVPGVDVDVNANAGMTKTDKNSDGKISKSEAAADSKLAKQFDKLDSNKDGNLDKGEFAKFEATGKASGKNDGAPGKDEGEPANQNNVPGTTDDSTPGNPDKLGPGR
jgi:EF hand